MKKNYIVIQDGIKECGSACLLSIVRYYGGNVSLSQINELSCVDKNGTSFYNLQLAAKELGFISKGYKIENIDTLEKIVNPFISQVVINNYSHFVVIYKINNNQYTIMDPAKGMIKLSKEEYLKIQTGYILTLQPYKKIPQYNDENYIVSILKNIIIKNKKLILNLILLSIIATIFTCIYSYYFKVIIDNTINTSKLNVLIVTMIFFIIFIIKIFTEYLRNDLLLYLNQKIDLSIITTTINKIILLPYNYYKNKTTGEIISRVNDLFYIKNIISKIIITIFVDVILSLTTFIILYKINKQLTYKLFIIIIIYIIIFFLFKKIIKRMTNITQENNSQINSLLVESISGYESIKGLNIEKITQSKINKWYLKSINDNFYFSKTINIENLLKDLFEGIIILFIIYLGINNVMDKSLTIGSLITFNSIVYYFLTPIKTSLEFYQEYYYAKNSIQRINNILNLKYEKLDKLTELPLNGNIIISKLSFSYNNNIILKSISTSFSSNDKVLLLGPSGSGKSSLLKIIYKYHEIPRGMIYINNYDINDYSLLDIRKNITYISQNEIIYTDTIKNNIVLERNISDKDFINVCKLTYIDEFIKKNNISYDFPLEENGANISGGQRQRIILARALLKESKILLIDEGLNQIDSELERKILKNIFGIYQDKLIIIVSHRYNNKDLYSKIIKLKLGKMKEVVENK